MTSHKGGRLAAKEMSHFVADVLNEEEVSDGFQNLSSLFDTSYGRDGSLTNVHNRNGGHVIVTSQSLRLLQSINVTRPLNRLIISVLQGHVNRYMDCGLFAGRFALYLTRNSIQLGFNRHLVIEVLNLLHGLCRTYLESSECNVKFKFSDETSERTRQMLALVRSIISTKVACGLSSDDVTYLAKLCLETYLTTLRTANDEESQYLHFILLEGYKPSECRLIEGILFETPQIPSYASSAVNNIKRVLSDNENAARIRVLLVSSSMAGDYADFSDVTFETDDRGSLQFAVVDKFLKIAADLVEQRVGVVACQKVIHPEVKQFLEGNDVLVLDRLGRTHVTLVQNLIGGEIVHSLEQGWEQSYGYLDDLHHCVYNNKSYVQLRAQGSGVATVLLANRSDESLAELKSVFDSSLQALRVCAASPYYLAGGGCWQTALASYIKSTAMPLRRRWTDELEAPYYTLEPIIDLFTLSLRKAAQPITDTGYINCVDRSHAHNWCLATDVNGSTSCACGMVNYSKQLEFSETAEKHCEIADRLNSLSIDNYCKIVDTFTTCKGALQCSVSLATMLLGTSGIMQQTN